VSGLSFALGAAFAVALVSLEALALYMLALVVLGALARTPSRNVSGVSPPRIAVLFAAHDEEAVIGDSVERFLGQDYPEGGFRVFVVADHCRDRTADIARARGATVLERNEGRGGKTGAVAFGVSAVERLGGFDAVAVFDADNHAAPGFLSAVGARIALGERVVQGLVDSKNPAASWVTASSALGFYAIAALAQEPRERLGLSTPLMGTGFAIRMRDALHYLGDAESLTDDLELGARLALDGVRVAYERAARTIDEKPVQLSTAVEQRQRWMQGRWAVAERYLPKLLGRALSPGGGSAGARFRVADVAFQLVAPSLLFTAVAILMVTSVGIVLGAVLPPSFSRVAFIVPPSLSLYVGGVAYLVPALGILRMKPPAAVWPYYLLQSAYLALSAPLAVTGWLRRRGRVWKRTPKGAGAPP
jgi:cellulose synthase/poly-beta-1,6-N-acetylglucosamine synthase-like glycosyltransferase